MSRERPREEVRGGQGAPGEQMGREAPLGQREGHRRGQAAMLMALEVSGFQSKCPVFSVKCRRHARGWWAGKSVTGMSGCIGGAQRAGCWEKAEIPKSTWKWAKAGGGGRAAGPGKQGA